MGLGVKRVSRFQVKWCRSYEKAGDLIELHFTATFERMALCPICFDKDLLRKQTPSVITIISGSVRLLQIYITVRFDFLAGLYAYFLYSSCLRILLKAQMANVGAAHHSERSLFI